MPSKVRSGIRVGEDEVDARYRILQLSTTPAGIRIHFLELLKAVAREKKYSVAHRKMKEELEAQNDKWREERKIALEWILERIDILKKSRFINNFEVKCALEQLQCILGWDDLIKYKGYFWIAISYFEMFFRAIVAYGDIGNMDWLKVKTVSDSTYWFTSKQSGFSSDFIQSCFGKELQATSEEGNKVIKILGHGFINGNFQMSTVSLGLSFHFHYNIVQEITYPRGIQALFNTSNGNQWKIALDTMPSENFRYLQLFVQKHPLDLVLMPFYKIPESAAEAKKICDRQTLECFLSYFLKNHSLSIQQVCNDLGSIVNRLYAFLNESNVKNKELNKRGSRALQNEASEIAFQVLKELLLPLSTMERNKKSYGDFYTPVLKQAKERCGDETFEALSYALVMKQCAKIAKILNWRPKRGKDKKKRVSNY